MALELHIHSCILSPPHPLHLPPVDKPLRIRLQGPLKAIQKVIPDSVWHLDGHNPPFPQSAGLDLASLTFRHLYGREASRDIVDDLVVRDEYLGWVEKRQLPTIPVNYYGVTFDHLVPRGDRNPEVLALNIFDNDEDMGEYAKQWLLVTIDPADYIGKKVLVVPRCCQKKRGTLDRRRINSEVIDRSQAVVLPLETGWQSSLRSFLGYGPRVDIVDYEDDTCTLGEEECYPTIVSGPSLLAAIPPSQDRTTFRGIGGGNSIKGWPSAGGIWELSDAGVVEFDFLDLPRFTSSVSQRSSEQEDLFCQRLAYIGARFYATEKAWLQDGKGLHRPQSTVLYGWPGAVPDDGVWALSIDPVAAYNLGVSRINNAITMQERCCVLEMLGGKFYAKWEDAPKIDIVEGDEDGADGEDEL